MVLDSYAERPRLLVSSDDQRNPIKPGQIYAVELADDTVKALLRVAEPADLVLHPHGLDLVRSSGVRVLLYVISHPETEGGSHSVAEYELLADRPLFLRELRDPLLASPNDLAAHADGSLFVSNDRSAKSGMTEIILRLRCSSNVFFNGKSWSLAAARENRIYAFPILPGGGLGERKVLAKLKGPDNITLSGGAQGGELLAASHYNSLAFMSHARNPRKRSPSMIYAIDVATGALRPVFSDDGRPYQYRLCGGALRPLAVRGSGIRAVSDRVPSRARIAGTSFFREI